MTEEDITAFNRRSQQSESLVARSLFTAGISWPGVMVWDDLRSLDYLASRPEVDRVGSDAWACRSVGTGVSCWRRWIRGSKRPSTSDG